jgi:hypothetical protein
MFHLGAPHLGADHMVREARKPSHVSRFRRLREAIAEHNWFSVAIEILIVTVGILLAFEIEQWGQRRARAAQEQQFMEELYADTQSGIAELKGLLEAHDRVLRDVPVALEARGNPAKISALPRRRDFGCGLTRPLLAPYNDTAYEELVQSGRISLLSDPKLRTLIRDLVASQKWGASQGTFTLELLNISLPPVTPYYDVTLSRDFDPLCRIDWPRLLSDDQAVYAVTRLVRRHRVVWEVRKRTFDLTLQVQQTLACKLDKPECRR